ncbi:PCRF domain-containing protein [Desulfofalx alkaliphila]|uniref:PCRF domain-containing protein n=1 Tax=Desulfofalx alkaliphila TaxID=105483 RepID=UPI0004E1EE21|nr:PCRF domain-containing protein [Desulfofalx alkaliphila]
MHIFWWQILSDDEILSRIESIIDERDEIENLLAQPKVSTDPEKVPELAKRMHWLDDICLVAEELKEYLSDLKELEGIVVHEGVEDLKNEFYPLYEEYKEIYKEKAARLYQLLMGKGIWMKSMRMKQI